MTGWGTKTCWRPGIPFTLATDRTTRSNLSVWTATVGTPYWASIVIACAATAGAQLIGFRTVSLSFIPMGPPSKVRLLQVPDRLPQLVQVSRRDDRLPDYDRGVGERPHLPQRRPQLGQVNALDDRGARGEGRIGIGEGREAVSRSERVDGRTKVGDVHGLYRRRLCRERGIGEHR